MLDTASRYLELGVAELDGRRPAAAVTALRRALGLDPTLVTAHNNLGIALKELGHLHEAETAYRNALDLNPQYAPAYHNLGELLQRRGQLEEARGCYEKALQFDPRLIPSRTNLGNVLADLSDLEAAVNCYNEAIAQGLAPGSVYSNLGIALRTLGNAEKALEAFERAAANAPDSAEAHYNLASALLESHRFTAAMQSAEHAMYLRPKFPEAQALYATTLASRGDIDRGFQLFRQAHSPDIPVSESFLLLAGKLMTLKLFDQARCCLERALEDNPADVMARHLLAAVRGENPTHPADGYVQQLFESGAATFDKELLSELAYCIPRKMVDALVAIDNARAQPWDVLDLGCGTGLVGVEIASHTRSLVGVDLAANMIERARSRGVYTELHCADIQTVLDDPAPGRYDVITAADVFVYVGKLDEVIAGVRRALRANGLFAFSVEPLNEVMGPGYRLGSMGRYAHNVEYLKSLALRNRFDINVLSKTRIRLEHRVPVEGWLTVWSSIEP